MIDKLERHIRDLIRQLLDDADAVTKTNFGFGVARNRPLLVANWKMNMGLQGAQSYIDGLMGAPYEACQVICCPPFPLLSLLEMRLKGLGIELGAQNVHEEQRGAFTGEVHAELLSELGCKYVIVGHSERRAIGESDEQIARKLRQASDHSLIPILCLGESQLQREQGSAKQVIRTQLVSALEWFDTNSSGLVIAYEPVWAIGTGKTALPADAQEIHRFIRDELAYLKGYAYSENVPLIYGGSVTSKNIREFCAEKDIDGAIVGGASLTADSFEAIISALQQGVAK